MRGGSLLVFFLLLFYFFPSPPIRSGELFSSVIFSSLSLLLFVFFGCSDGMEREACVCDHGFERSNLCAEIIKINNNNNIASTAVLVVYTNSTNITTVVGFLFLVFLFLSRICLVGEKPDKELPGIVGARGDTV